MMEMDTAVPAVPSDGVLTYDTSLLGTPPRRAISLLRYGVSTVLVLAWGLLVLVLTIASNLMSKLSNSNSQRHFQKNY